MRKDFIMADSISAHGFCTNNMKQLAQSTRCGCFHCEKIFNSVEIHEWIPGEDTAVCPYCEIDAVIAEGVGIQITKEFLREMNLYWFGEREAL